MIETDYLVVGAGASGLAFADSLVEQDPEADLVVVDRRAGPGGHWLDAYPFVKLHIPSAFYGVNSLPLGSDQIDEVGENAGFYERATGAEICDYFAEVATRLTETSRVRILFEHEHLLEAGEGAQRVRDLRDGVVHEVEVRRKVVDARYQEASIPATHEPSFEVAEDAEFVPVNDLPEVAAGAERFAVLGSGKTAVDACTWLMDNDVPPDRIRWVRPRDAWFHHRRHFQPLDQVAENMHGISLDAEAGAKATDLQDLFDRLEATDRLVRLDTSVAATMYRGTLLSPPELEAVRGIDDVIRLGYVRSIERDRIVLQRGEIETDESVVHVDCTAHGLRNAPPMPIFQGDRIVLQQVRQNSPTFNAALIAFVESNREDDAERNDLCRPNPFPSSVADWPGMSRRTFQVEQRWLQEPDLARWIAGSRLNLLRGLTERLNEPVAKAGVERFVTYIAPAIQRLQELEPASV